MPILSTATPTVILKSVAHGGLALVRSLGREGVAVYTVEGDPWVPAIHSRYSRGWVNLDVETASCAHSKYGLCRDIHGGTLSTSSPPVHLS